MLFIIIDEIKMFWEFIQLVRDKPSRRSETLKIINQKSKMSVLLYILLHFLP